MKAHTRTALTLLIGIGLGATTIEMLRAQGKQPVYFIYQTELIPFGGRFLVRGGKATRVEGDAPLPRISIIEFDSLDKAQGWYNSAAYQKLVPVRQGVMKTNSFIAENPN
jgi:uncharacterized protein (DUF1330 family)